MPMRRTLARALLPLLAAAPLRAEPPVRGADLRLLRDVCAAYARRDESACRGPAREDCLGYVRVLPVLRAYAGRDPAFLGLCLDLARRRDAGGLAEDASLALCRAWEARSGDPGPLVDAVAAAYQSPPTREELLQAVGEMTLRRPACETAASPAQREICLQAADYRDGRCGGGLCRALRGDPSACAAYGGAEGGAP